MKFTRTNYFTESEYYRVLRYSADTKYRLDTRYRTNILLTRWFPTFFDLGPLSFCWRAREVTKYIFLNLVDTINERMQTTLLFYFRINSKESNAIFGSILKASVSMAN